MTRLAWLADHLPARMRTALRVRQTIMLEYGLATQAVLWGVWVAMPQSTAFVLLEGTPTLLDVVPEAVWGTVVALHGLAYLRAIRLAVRQKEHGPARRGSQATVGIWSFVLLTFAIAVPSSAVVPLYFWNTLAALWVSLRMSLRFG